MPNGGELPEDIEDDLQDIANRCESENIPPNNLDSREFTPGNLQSIYDDVIERVQSRNDISNMDIWNYLGKNVQIDPNRESKYYLWDIAVLQKDNVIFDNYPSLRDLGQSGLKSVPEQADMNKNGFSFRNHYLIFCSRLSQNYYLIGKLGELRSGTVGLSVPISYNKLGLPDTTRNTILAEHWRGPETIDELRSRAGHKFFVQKSGESYQCGLQDRTEFLFEKRDNEWHLQIEELLPRTGIRYSPHTQLRKTGIKYNTRYLHAILDEECRNCFHLDGALRGYNTAENFIDRHRDTDLENSNLLKDMSDRYKLFKLDSSAGDITDFGEIAGLFFKHNPYVQRFFEGDSDHANEIEEQRIELFRFDFEKEDVLDEFDVA